jgi:hypothetical protein
MIGGPVGEVCGSNYGGRDGGDTEGQWEGSDLDLVDEEFAAEGRRAMTASTRLDGKSWVRCVWF